MNSILFYLVFSLLVCIVKYYDSKKRIIKLIPLLRSLGVNVDDTNLPLIKFYYGNHEIYGKHVMQIWITGLSFFIRLKYPSRGLVRHQFEIDGKEYRITVFQDRLEISQRMGSFFWGWQPIPLETQEDVKFFLNLLCDAADQWDKKQEFAGAQNDK